MTDHHPPEQPDPAPGATSAVRRRRRRSSVSSAVDSVLATAKQAEAKLARTLLLLWDDLPPWRRDNAYIATGYRPESGSYSASLASLAALHNETVNIWSHLLGALAFAATAAYLCALAAPRLPPAAAAAGPDALALGCFFAGAVGCLGMSAAYHALSNHSEPVARWGNKLDYSGIVLLIVGSFVPTLYYGLFCHPRLMAFYLYMISLLGLGCLAASWLERFRTPRWRPYRAAMFVALGLSGVVPVIHGAALHGLRALDDRMALRWTLLQGALYILGAVIYAVRWPERLGPGKFDIWGSSHQIFHVFVLLAAAAHLYGLAKAFDYHHSEMGTQC